MLNSQLSSSIKKLLHDKYTCFAGTFYVQIDPYGNVYTCNDYVFKLGNIKNTPFRKIWRGQAAKKIRKILRARKQQCVCWYNCNGILNCYLTKTVGRFDRK
jgi:radical SAM protein with 4Fe4S-binding SPASM domain